MKKYFLLIILIIHSITISAQINKTASVIIWQRTSDNKLLVEYSISNAKENETYELKIDFYDDNKTRLTAFALSGDFPKVTGPGTKTLYWDVLKDKQEFPIISDIKIEIKLIMVNEIAKINNTSQKPKSVQSSQKEQSSQNSQNNTTSKEVKEKTSQQVNNHRKKFTIGIHSGIGACSTQEIDAGSYGTFSSSLGGSRIYGGFIALGHFGFDFSKTDRSIGYKDDNNTEPTIDINSFNLSLDFYTDIPASPNKELGLLIGFGVGRYTTKYSDKLISKVTLRENEMAYYPRLGIIFPAGKNWKFAIIDSYHFTKSPFNDIKIAIYLGI